jgi:sugar lactone lactonase YvrE
MAGFGAGTVLAFDRNPDGSLGPGGVFASGLTTPDGMTVDRRGNVDAATWASTIEAFSPNGGPWGRVAIPRQATTRTFGGMDLRTLHVKRASKSCSGASTVPDTCPGAVDESDRERPIGDCAFRGGCCRIPSVSS